MSPTRQSSQSRFSKPLTRFSPSRSYHPVATLLMAVQYDVELLRRHATNRFQAVFDPLNNIDDFVSAIYAVDECTADRTLWEVVEPTIKANMAMLLGHKSQPLILI